MTRQQLFKLLESERADPDLEDKVRLLKSCSSHWPNLKSISDLGDNLSARAKLHSLIGITIELILLSRRANLVNSLYTNQLLICTSLSTRNVFKECIMGSFNLFYIPPTLQIYQVFELEAITRLI